MEIIGRVFKEGKIVGGFQGKYEWLGGFHQSIYLVKIKVGEGTQEYFVLALKNVSVVARHGLPKAYIVTFSEVEIVFAELKPSLTPFSSLSLPLHVSGADWGGSWHRLEHVKQKEHDQISTWSTH
jgi:hypothetical protein